MTFIIGIVGMISAGWWAIGKAPFAVPALCFVYLVIKGLRYAPDKEVFFGGEEE